MKLNFWKKENVEKTNVEKAKENVEKVKKAGKKILEPDVQVMMLGARRVGKTSVLASLYNQFNAITKGTNLTLTKGNGAKPIDDALNTMKEYFRDKHKNNEIIDALDTNATSGFTEFDMQLSVTGKKNIKPRTIRFIDCAGEWINNYSNQEEIDEKVEQSSIVVIAIDSVLLMEEKGKFNKQNCVQNVTNFIKKNMNPEENANNKKMVLFVPLKCEKYYHQHNDKQSRYYQKRMNDLDQRIKDEYSDLLGYLTKEINKEHFTVAILPILTLGGIEFYDFNDNVTEHTKEVTSDMMKYCYCAPEGASQPEFAPQYCEQPLLYALKYENKKINQGYYSNPLLFDAQRKRRVSGRIIEWFQDRRNLVKDIDYTEELSKLNEKIKKQGNGFEIIQDPLGI